MAALGAEEVRPLIVGMSWFPDVPGGLNRYLADLHAALTTDGNGRPPHTLVLGPCAAAPDGVLAVSDHRRPLLLRWLYLVYGAQRLVAEADVLDTHFALYALPIVFGPGRKLPLIVHFQGPWAAESSSAGSRQAAVTLKRWVERRVYRRATGMVTLSNAFKRLLVESYGAAPWSIDVIPPSVDLRRFSPGDRLTARARLGIPPDAIVVSTVRRLVPRMGVATLLRAWHQARDAIGPSSLLVVAGHGPEETSLRQLTSDLGISDGVRFAGRLSDEDLVQLYRASDAFVVPSLELEGFGLVLLEALACGTPVVASDVGGLPEALAGLDSNVVVPAGDEPALAARLISAFNGASPLPSPAECRFHAERYSPESIAAQHRQVYHRAVAANPSRNMRVVYLDHCARESGGELALLRLLIALGEVDAHVVLGEDGPLVDLLRREHISVEVLPMRSSARNLRKDSITSRRFPIVPAMLAGQYSVKVARRIHQLAPDLVHTNSLKAAVYGGFAARAARVPVLWHIRDRIDADYLPPTAVHLVHALSRTIPNALIANSHSTLATVPSYPDIRSVIPSPVIYDTVTLGPACARISSTELRIAMVGRIAPWKGQHLFIHAFAQAFPDPGPTATIVGGPLFGEDQYETSLHVLVSNLGLTDRLQLTGHVTDVARVLAGCDIAVNASITPEPFGLVVVEAMAAGMAVVAPNAGGPAEIITDNVDGLLFEPGSASALAAALVRLRDDPVLRLRLGIAARRRAADFSANNVANQVMDLYRNILSAGHRAASGQAP